MSEKKSTSFSEKIKGAAHVVHGIGENIRGSVMGAVESVSGSEEGKNKDEDIIAKGRSEIEQGIARMKGMSAPTGGEAEKATGDTQAQVPEAAKPEKFQPTGAPTGVDDTPPPQRQTQDSGTDTPLNTGQMQSSQVVAENAQDA